MRDASSAGAGKTYKCTSAEGRGPRYIGHRREVRREVRLEGRAVFGSVALVVMYTEAMLLPSLPKIQEEFNVTPADASWILTSTWSWGP